MTEYQYLELYEKQDVFLQHPFDDFVVRFDFKTNSFFAKPKGGTEYKIEETTNLVLDAKIEAILISSQEYQDY